MGKSSTRAQNKYISKAYDRINLVVPRGYKDVIQAQAEKHSESLNGYIKKAIEMRMNAEKDTPSL